MATAAGVAVGTLAQDSVQRVVPLTGDTVVASAGTTILLLVPAGTLATLTVTFPATPADLQLFSLCTTQILTSLTLNGGTIVNPLTTLALGAGAKWIYSTTDSKWLRLQ